MGLLGQRLWVRPDSNDGAESNQESKETAEAKESARCQAMLETSTEGLPSTMRVLTVADREADIFDFLVEAVRLLELRIAKVTLRAPSHRGKEGLPPHIKTAVLWIARLGGFLPRKGDGAPGVQVLWRGYRRLQDMADLWDLFNSTN